MVRHLKSYPDSKALFNDGYWLHVYSPYGMTFKKHDDEVTVSGDFIPLRGETVLVGGVELKRYILPEPWAW